MSGLQYHCLALIAKERGVAYSIGSDRHINATESRFKHLCISGHSNGALMSLFQDFGLALQASDLKVWGVACRFPLFPLPGTERNPTSNMCQHVREVPAKSHRFCRYRIRTASFCTHTFPPFTNVLRGINTSVSENPA